MTNLIRGFFYNLFTLIVNVKWRTSFHTMKIYTIHYGAKSFIKSKSHLFHNFLFKLISKYYFVKMHVTKVLYKATFESIWPLFENSLWSVTSHGSWDQTTSSLNRYLISKAFQFFMGTKFFWSCNLCFYNPTIARFYG